MILVILSTVLSPLYLLALTIQANRGILRHRLGLLPSQPRPSIWLHGASVGEIISLQALVKQIKKDEPNTPLVISTNTVTGYQAIKDHYSAVTPIYLPLDSMGLTDVALRCLRAKKVIVTEAERWPTLFWRAYAAGIPIVAYNARLSDKPLWWGKRWFYASIYKQCAQIMSQHPAPFKGLNLPKRVAITAMGSPKAASALMRRQAYQAAARKPAIPLLLVGSVHPDELAVYRQLWDALATDNTPVHLLLVARHPNAAPDLITAFNNIDALIDHQLPVDISALGDQPRIITTATMGVLYDLYQYATLFYLGGTFNNVGGHNVLEPVSWALPIISGPHISKTNYEALALERAGGLYRTRDVHALKKVTQQLLSDPQRCAARGAANFDWLKKQG